MARFSLQAHDKLSGANVPDTDALVEGAGRDEAVVWGNGNSGDTIFDREVGDLFVPLQVPEADAAITTAGRDDLAVAGEVEGVDVLLVAGELVLDLAALNVPHADNLVFGTSGEILAVRAEAYAPDVQVTILWQASVLEVSDGVAGLDVEDLGRAVAACRNIATIKTEAYTADDALMRQVVDQVDVEHTPGARVEDGEPIAALLLQVLRKLLDVEIGQNITLSERHVVLVSCQGILLLL